MFFVMLNIEGKSRNVLYKNPIKHQFMYKYLIT